MESSCRLCVKPVFDLSSVYQFKNGQIVTDLIKKIIPEVKIERNDKFSKLICGCCLEIIVSADELRTVAINNATIMGSLLDKRIELKEVAVVKIEPLDDNFAITQRFDLKPLTIPLERIDESFLQIKKEEEEAVIDFEVIECTVIKQEKRFRGAGPSRTRCEHCKKRFKTSKLLERHVSNAHNPNQVYFKCEACESLGVHKQFLAESRLLCHIKARHSSEDKTTKLVPKEPREKRKVPDYTGAFTCDKCGLSYMSIHSLSAHSQVHNKKKPSRTMCKVCKEDFEFWGQMKLHSMIHCDYVEKFEDPNQKLKCSLCFYLTKVDEELQLHLPSHQHDFQSKEVVDCVRCSVKFRNYEGFVEHTKEHNAKTTHRCKRCYKTFTEGRKLLMHLMRHQNKFSCDLCGEEKSTKQTIIDHIDFAHRKEGLLCPICGEKKATRSAFNSHMQFNHQERKYKCASCEKSFANYQSFNIHQSQHLEVAVRWKNFKTFNKFMKLSFRRFFSARTARRSSNAFATCNGTIELNI